MKILATLLVAALATTSLYAGPKRLLVVTTTTGFRHSSIPTAEKILAQLAKASGEFSIDFVQQPLGKPDNLKNGATADEKAAFDNAVRRWEAMLKRELEKLSPANLKNYDGVVFASTTGDLPLPDMQGFLDWIKAGHAFIGIHAASDTFHGSPEFIAMLGGEFAHHGKQLGVECLNQDSKNPATAHLGNIWKISQEEMYQLKNYDATKLHDLLILDKQPELPYTPGHFPVSWCKPYGNGKVFYTSLGHREDIWDTDPDINDRKNDPATSKAYQQHILGGIEWALGLKK